MWHLHRTVPMSRRMPVRSSMRKNRLVRAGLRRALRRFTLGDWCLDTLDADWKLSPEKALNWTWRLIPTGLPS
jgi:hypothetical protein